MKYMNKYKIDGKINTSADVTPPVFPELFPSLKLIIDAYASDIISIIKMYITTVIVFIILHSIGAAFTNPTCFDI